jgi:hypothetical protein
LDHCLESEFYEGQIECVFTPSSLESRPFRGRSAFLEACWSRFGVKIAHLDKEVLDLASSLVSCAAVIARAGHSAPWEKPEAWLQEVTTYLGQPGSARRCP